MKVLTGFIVVMTIAMSPALPGDEARTIQDSAEQLKDIAEKIDALDAAIRSNMLTRTEKDREFWSLSKLIAKRKREKEDNITIIDNTQNRLFNNMGDLPFDSEQRKKLSNDRHELTKQWLLLREVLELLEVYEKSLQSMQAREEGCPFLCTDNRDGTVTCGGIIYRQADTFSDSPG